VAVEEHFKGVVATFEEVIVFVLLSQEEAEEEEEEEEEEDSTGRVFEGVAAVDLEEEGVPLAEEELNALVCEAEQEQVDALVCKAEQEQVRAHAGSHCSWSLGKC
jgi:hypothetical protein